MIRATKGYLPSLAIVASLLASANALADEVTLGIDPLTSGIPGTGELTEEQLTAWLNDPANHEELEVSLPLGMAAGQSQIRGLAENPLTRAKIELGRQLYFDTRLSADNTISCASCHHPDEGYSRHTQFGIGVGNQEGGRNSPVSYNRILSDLQFWDGRAASLEEQAVGPIANPIEMSNTHDICVATLREIPGYVQQFDAIFGVDSLNIDNVGRAIAAFERTLVTGPAPFDYYEVYVRYEELDPLDLEDLLADDPEFAAQYEAARTGIEAHPMSESAIRGRQLFFSERVNCAACHVGANLADEKFHNLGIGMDAENPDLGRYVVTGEEADIGAFKTPTIRNVALTAPYMHDGSLRTLEEVVEHYNIGGTPNEHLSDKIRRLNLTAQEKTDLVEFMRACTGSLPYVFSGRLPPDQW